MRFEIAKKYNADGRTRLRDLHTPNTDSFDTIVQTGPTEWDSVQRLNTSPCQAGITRRNTSMGLRCVFSVSTFDRTLLASGNNSGPAGAPRARVCDSRKIFGSRKRVSRSRVLASPSPSLPSRRLLRLVFSPTGPGTTVAGSVSPCPFRS